MLSFFDERIMESAELRFYSRFIDDCLTVIKRGSVDRFLAIANDWRPCIVTDLACEPGAEVAYLDLTVSLVHHTGDQVVHFSIFRKPLNKYMYLPRSSCHSPHIFLSMCFGEALRVSRRCTSKHAVQRQNKFLTGKLVAKRYSNRETSQGVSNAFLASRSRNGPSKSTKRQVFLKLKHSSSVNYAFLLFCTRRLVNSNTCMVTR